MEIKFNNMLEVSELISALEDRKQFITKNFPTDNNAKIALENIIEQVKNSYPYFFTDQEDMKRKEK